jgi:hypothetical protein
MKQEDKDLLLKDLCARLPYGVKVQHQHQDYLNEVQTIEKISKKYGEIETESILGFVDDFKPYLFPLSSMTEEQCYGFYSRYIENQIDYDDFIEFYFKNNKWHKLLTSIDDCGDVIDWFNRNHFDYRGLIPKGLAIDATGLNIYNYDY